VSLNVAIVGRPNVGKSTLFNRLVGRRAAIVDESPGVTRDRREGDARLGPLQFRVWDTAGFENASASTLEGRMRVQTQKAVVDADIALLLIDARAGVSPLDKQFANLLRKQATPLILVANKCEGRGGESGLLESYSLGLDEPIAISAEHGEGLELLYEAITTKSAHLFDDATEDRAEPGAEIDDPIINLAIVGRPNVGKSTLVNKLIGDERMLTGPEPGITRDSIAIEWVVDGQRLRLVDTAGLRRRARISEHLEKLSTADSLRSLGFAEVVLLVIDAEQGFEKQDLTIARRITQEGRALVVVVNKWDLVENAEARLKVIADRLQRSLPQIKGIKLITLSALSGAGVEKLLPATKFVYQLWNTRIGTSPLNQWIAEVESRHPPPLVRGRRIRLKYVTQAKARPPTFVVFVSRPESLPDSYIRYLENDFRKRFKIPAVPIRIFLRKGKNPYAK
jgi:GTP-binding protein